MMRIAYLVLAGLATLSFSASSDTRARLAIYQDDIYGISLVPPRFAADTGTAGLIATFSAPAEVTLVTTTTNVPSMAGPHLIATLPGAVGRAT